MKKLVGILLASGLIAACSHNNVKAIDNSSNAITNQIANSSATVASGISNSTNLTVYLNAKPVDQKIIDLAINQFKKSSPYAAGQINNPQFKREILQSIGMQQALLEYGNAKAWDKTPEFAQKLQQATPMIYAQMLQQQIDSTPISDKELQAQYDKTKAQTTNNKKNASAPKTPTFAEMRDQLTQQIKMENMKKAFDDIKTQYKVEVSAQGILTIAGIPVEQKLIDQTMNQIKKSSPMMVSQLNNPQFKKQVLESIGMQQALIQYAQTKGWDKSNDFKTQIVQVTPMIYAQILQDQVSAQVISDKDLQTKYDALKLAASKQQQFEVSHILVKDQKTADEIEAKLKAGGNFTALAKQYSQDPGSKTKGGDLGWSDGNNYVPEFTAGIRSLKKGQYTTTPVKSQFGYHIIKLVDIKFGPTTPIAPFSKMKEQLKQQIQGERVRQAFEDLKTQYKIEVK